MMIRSLVQYLPTFPGRFSLSLLPGLLLCVVLSSFAIVLGQTSWFSAHGIGALTLAVLIGMLAGNSFYPRLSRVAAGGVGFSKQRLLRLGIILYGLRLSLQDVAGLGVTGVLLDAVMLGSTFLLAIVLGTRVFRLDPASVLLIGAGSSICGAAAVMAAEPVVRGKPEQVTVAVSSVVLFGSLAMFLYPLLFSLNQQWAVLPQDGHYWGMYVGATVHEVAQVVAAGNAISLQATDSAVIAKLVRVMMLAPVLLLLSFWINRSRAGEAHEKETAITIPWFAVGFLVMVVVASLVKLPTELLEMINALDGFLLAMAMVALGLDSRWSSIRRAGCKPLLLAALLFFWLVVGGGALSRLLF